MHSFSEAGDRVGQIILLSKPALAKPKTATREFSSNTLEFNNSKIVKSELAEWQKTVTAVMIIRICIPPHSLFQLSGRRSLDRIVGGYPQTPPYFPVVHCARLPLYLHPTVDFAMPPDRSYREGRELGGYANFPHHLDPIRQGCNLMAFQVLARRK
jgi:hypothetical protein